MYNGTMLNTGCEAVNVVGTYEITGNVVPNNWFRWILRNNGKPNHFAISILSEIVYWYKPVEVRDEESGMTVGYRKKFRDDCLQKSYEQLSLKFGEEKQTVKRALDCLEKVGVIRREFRTVTIGADKKKLNNVMYIHLIPEVLYKITYVDAAENVDNSIPVIKSDDTLPSDLMGGSNQICGEAPDKFEGTNTENTTEITNRDYHHPIHLLGGIGSTTVDKSKGMMDRMDEISAYRDLVKENIEYEALMRNCRYDSDKEQIDEIYELLCEVVCMTAGYVRIGGQDLPYQVVQSMFLKLKRHHIEYVIECMEKTVTEVGNMRAYLLTALYRSMQSFQNSLDQQVRHDIDRKSVV